jgi:hypothetical protein
MTFDLWPSISPVSTSIWALPSRKRNKAIARRQRLIQLIKAGY